MKPQKTSISLVILCILALIISIGTFCFSFFRMEPVSFDIDRYSFTIDTLSLLVTILIGWQVINIISFERRMKDIVYKETAKLRSEFEKRYTVLEGNIYFTNGISAWSSNPLEAYKCFIAAIPRYLSANHIRHYQICLSNMKSLLDNIEDQLKTDNKNSTLLKNNYIEEAISILKKDEQYNIIKEEFEDLEKRRSDLQTKYAKTE